MGWDDWHWRGYYPPTPPKLPPPRHGIKVKKFGATWWGQRWLLALEQFSSEYAARLKRGRSYARQGRVHDLEVTGGEVRAQVTGTRPIPYRVTIRVAPLSGRIWNAAIRAMAKRALFAARLLSGEMPQEIDEAFHAARASLFPQQIGDLSTDCTCPDWANPCKHVAAIHYVLGEAFDRDPFLLFELRGRSREQVLAALRRFRAVSQPSASAEVALMSGERTRAAEPVRAAEPARAADTVTLKDISAQNYDGFREPAGDLRFHITTPAVNGAVLRQLGTPPSWSLRASPMEFLYPAVAAAAALARELALGSPLPTQGSSISDPHHVAGRRRSRRAGIDRYGGIDQYGLEDP